jgi:alpha-glucosidase
VKERWWRDAVIYQIYPRSFADSNGDGVGDLDGVTSRLDHLVSLGVDALWLTPINPSGGADGGYDVMDYTNVDPVYGGLEAFDRLVAAAHDRGLRVLVDIVPNHTSDRHPWFVEARSSRSSPKRDWFVWADGREGGTAPPNNWVSTFLGPAWCHDAGTGQWFLTSFYPEQADLNWENPEVRHALTDAMRFWRERGADGFRIDVVQRLSKDPLLRDNPPPADDAEWARAGRYDEDGPLGPDRIGEVRRALGDEVALLGEVWLLDVERIYRYVGPGLLDLAFAFPFAMAPWNPRLMMAVIEQVERLTAGDVRWPTYHVSNHDTPRAGTRFGAGTVRAALTLLLTLRGTPVLFQGDELGLVDSPVPPERMVDRVGRDGARTPMPWDPSPNAGFTSAGAEPWLPIGEHLTANVASQAEDPDSVLALTRRLISLRRSSDALRRGRFGFVAATRSFLTYLREAGDERHLVALNFSDIPEEIPVQPGRVEVASTRSMEDERVRHSLKLPAFGAAVVRLD